LSDCLKEDEDGRWIKRKERRRKDVLEDAMNDGLEGKEKSEWRIEGKEEWRFEVKEENEVLGGKDDEWMVS